MRFNPGCKCCGCDGSSCVAFVTDNTGSMGSNETTLESYYNQLVDDDDFADTCFAVIVYVDSGSGPIVKQKFTKDKTKLHSAINGMTAGGGGDTPEDDLYALHDTATKWADNDGGSDKRVIIWAGDAEGHTTPYSLSDTTTALTDASIKVLALNCAGAGVGLDANGGQATSITSATGGTLINSATSAGYAAVKAALQGLL